MPIVDDTVAERLERFRVTLIPTSESVAVSVGRGEATVEIADNDCESGDKHTHICMNIRDVSAMQINS